MRQLVVAMSGGWTAHFHNCLLGGDSVGWVVHLSAHFDCRGVIATHIPRGQYPLPATQFLLIETGASFRSRTLTLEQARREYAG